MASKNVGYYKTPSGNKSYWVGTPPAGYTPIPAASYYGGGGGGGGSTAPPSSTVAPSPVTAAPPVTPSTPPPSASASAGEWVKYFRSQGVTSYNQQAQIMIGAGVSTAQKEAQLTKAADVAKATSLGGSYTPTTTEKKNGGVLATAETSATKIFGKTSEGMTYYSTTQQRQYGPQPFDASKYDVTSTTKDITIPVNRGRGGGLSYTQTVQTSPLRSLAIETPLATATKEGVKYDVLGGQLFPQGGEGSLVNMGIPAQVTVKEFTLKPQPLQEVPAFDYLGPATGGKFGSYQPLSKYEAGKRELLGKLTNILSRGNLQLPEELKQQTRERLPFLQGTKEGWKSTGMTLLKAPSQIAKTEEWVITSALNAKPRFIPTEKIESFRTGLGTKKQEAYMNTILSAGGVVSPENTAIQKAISGAKTVGYAGETIVTSIGESFLRRPATTAAEFYVMGKVFKAAPVLATTGYVGLAGVDVITKKTLPEKIATGVTHATGFGMFYVGGKLYGKANSFFNDRTLNTELIGTVTQKGRTETIGTKTTAESIGTFTGRAEVSRIVKIPQYVFSPKEYILYKSKPKIYPVTAEIHYKGGGYRFDTGIKAEVGTSPKQQSFAGGGIGKVSSQKGAETFELVGNLQGGKIKYARGVRAYGITKKSIYEEGDLIIKREELFSPQGEFTKETIGDIGSYEITSVGKTTIRRELNLGRTIRIKYPAVKKEGVNTYIESYAPAKYEVVRYGELAGSKGVIDLIPVGKSPILNYKYSVGMKEKLFTVGKSKPVPEVYGRFSNIVRSEIKARGELSYSKDVGEYFASREAPITKTYKVENMVERYIPQAGKSITKKYYTKESLYVPDSSRETFYKTGAGYTTPLKRYYEKTEALSLFNKFVPKEKPLTNKLGKEISTMFSEKGGQVLISKPKSELKAPRLERTIKGSTPSYAYQSGAAAKFYAKEAVRLSLLQAPSKAMYFNKVTPKTGTFSISESRTASILQPSVRVENRYSLKPELRNETRPDLRNLIKPDLRSGQKPDLRNELKPDLRNELKPDLKTELRPDLRTELRPELRTELKPNILVGLSIKKPPIIPPFRFSRSRRDFPKTKSLFRMKLYTKYQPSLLAGIKNIRGKIPKELTGLEIRPIMRI